MIFRLSNLRLYVSISLGAFCGSCSTGFDIQPSGTGGDIRLTFVPTGSSRRDEVECISKIAVAEEEWPTRTPGRVIWQIESISGCTALSSIDVGHVPDGFAEVVDRLPLVNGHMYAAIVDAGSEQRGFLPWFVCRKNPAIVAWKNENHLEDPPDDCLHS